MEERHIFEGKTTTEAVEKGLKELGLKKSDVEIIPVKNEEKRSFFSILEPRVVKVELKIKESNLYIKEEKKVRVEKEKKEMSEEAISKAKSNIEEFLKEFLPKISEENLEYKIYDDKYYIYVDINGEKTNHLIGYRGETLNAMQTLLGTISNKNIDEKVRIILDISGYREKRKKVLEELVEKVAKTVEKTRKKIVLEPMSAYERKIIHSRLQKNNKVTTESVGEEPNRKVAIFLKNK